MTLQLGDLAVLIGLMRAVEVVPLTSDPPAMRPLLDEVRAEARIVEV